MATYFHNNFGAQIILWVKGSIEGINTTCIEDPLTPNLEITQIVLHRVLPLDSQESPSARVIAPWVYQSEKLQKKFSKTKWTKMETKT
jgi:hypothetical protein